MYRFSSPINPAFRRRFAATLLGISVTFIPIFVAAQAVAEQADAVAIFNNAQDLHEKGDLAGAIKLYDKALKIMPEFPEAEYQRGMAELATGNVDEAERSFRRAVDLRPDWSLALAKLGETLVSKYISTSQTAAPKDRTEAFEEVSNVIAKAIALDPNNFPAIVALVDLQVKSGASTTALGETLVKVTEITDGKMSPLASLWTARAALESALGKQTAAKTSLRKALTIDPKNKTALLQMADIAVSEGDTSRASEIISRLDNGSPTDPIKLLKARILSQEGKLDDAVKQLDSLKQQNSDAVELKKKIDAMRTTSTADLEKMLEANGKDAIVLGKLCNLYRRDEPVKAINYCRRAVEAEPGNVTHAVGFGAALVQAKQYDAAVGVLKRIIEIVPDNSTAHANLATALFQLKRYPEAKTEFEWLTNAQPRSAGAYLFLGIIHDQLNEFMDAMANYQQYLKLADPVENKLDIEKINLRLPQLQKSIKDGKKKS